MLFSTALLLVTLQAGASTSKSADDPTLAAVMQKVGAYVAGYGRRASLFVGSEKYTQRFNASNETTMIRPRRLVAEFAIVKVADGSGWLGLRDVVEVDGKAVQDRRNRLEALLTSSSSGAAQAARLSEESARYNVGPISRNFNVPTATLFFFGPQHLSRFTFEKRRTQKNDGTETWEVEFVETARPTLIVTRDGRDVPCEGKLWVIPSDGTVVKTLLILRGFADRQTAATPKTPLGLPRAGFDRERHGMLETDVIRSEASIEVGYRRHETFDVWLPANMTEFYDGPIQIGTQPPFQGRATTRASYSDYKRFEAAATFRVK